MGGLRKAMPITFVTFLVGALAQAGIPPLAGFFAKDALLEVAQHSGAFGGPLPDAVMALARMVASLHDDAGNITLRGLRSFEWAGTQVPEAEFIDDARVLPGVRLIGSGTIADRTMSKPAINVLAFEAPRVADAANQIVPTARAVIDSS